MPDPVLLSDAFRLRSAARFRVVDGEAVILLQDSGDSLVLDPVGTAVLERLDGRRDVEALAASLLDEFDGDPETMRADVTRFLDELRRARVIEPAGEGEGVIDGATA